MNEIERLREKAGHDEAQALHTAELKGEIKGRAKAKAEIAQNLIKTGMSIQKVAEVTGLEQSDTEAIYKSLHLP